MAKNLSSSISSLEDHYHAGASDSVSVPFTWESQPGTPKAKFLQNPNIPPLTPPPSYFYSKTKGPLRKKYSSSLLLQNIFPKKHSATQTTSRKVPPSSSSSPASSSLSLSSSSSSSSASSTAYYSVPSSPVTLTMFRARGRSMSSPKVLVDSRVQCHEYKDCSRRFSSRGCYLNFIKVFLREFH